MTSGPGVERVRLVSDQEHYIANWVTSSLNLDVSLTYRIRVLDGGFELGYADVDVVETGRELSAVDTRQFVPLVKGTTLPIKFRIERGVIPADLASLRSGVQTLLTSTSPVMAFQQLTTEYDRLVQQVGRQEARRKLELASASIDPQLQWQAIRSVYGALGGRAYDVPLPESSPAAPLAVPLPSGSSVSGGTTVIYVNGIMTSPEAAIATKGDLADVVMEAFPVRQPGEFRIRHVYNRSFSDSLDQQTQCLLTAAQRLISGWGVLAVLDLLSSCIPGLVDIRESARQVLQLMAIAPSVIEPDAAILASAIQEELAEGRRVIIIPHSQGNLMTQQALSKITSNRQCIAVISLAAPTSAWPNDVDLASTVVKGEEAGDFILWLGSNFTPPSSTAFSDQWDTVIRSYPVLPVFWRAIAWLAASYDLHGVNQYLSGGGRRDYIKTSLKGQVETLAGRCGEPWIAGGVHSPDGATVFFTDVTPFGGNTTARIEVTGPPGWNSGNSYTYSTSIRPSDRQAGPARASDGRGIVALTGEYVAMATSESNPALRLTSRFRIDAANRLPVPVITSATRSSPTTVQVTWTAAAAVREFTMQVRELDPISGEAPSVLAGQTFGGPIRTAQLTLSRPPEAGKELLVRVIAFSHVLFTGVPDPLVGQANMAETDKMVSMGSVVEIGSVSTIGIPKAITDSGALVGTYTVPGADRAFLWTLAGGREDLGTMGGLHSAASSANTRGDVVGWIIDQAGDTRSFLWSRTGGMRDLQMGVSIASDINDHGDIAGEMDQAIGFCRNAFLRHSDGAVQTIGHLANNVPSGCPYTSPRDLNEHRSVVGASTVASGSSHAFLWTPADGIRDLGTLGGASSIALAINDSEQVVGTSLTASGHSRAFIWTQDEGMRDLLGAAVGGGASAAYGINNAGEVVGTYINAAGSFQVFRWTKSGGIEDLPTAGGTVPVINNDGWIVWIGPSATSQQFALLLRRP